MHAWNKVVQSPWCSVLPPSLVEHQMNPCMKHQSNSKSMMFGLKVIHAWNIKVIQSPWRSVLNCGARSIVGLLNHLYALGHVPSYSKSMMFSLPPSFNIIQSLWCSPSLPLWTSKTFTHETSQQFKVYDVLPSSLFEHQRHSRMKHHSNSKSMMFSLPLSLNIKDIHASNIAVIQSPSCSVLPSSLFEHQRMKHQSNYKSMMFCPPSLPLWTK